MLYPAQFIRCNMNGDYKVTIGHSMHVGDMHQVRYDEMGDIAVMIMFICLFLALGAFNGMPKDWSK